MTQEASPAARYAAACASWMRHAPVPVHVAAASFEVGPLTDSAAATDQLRAFIAGATVDEPAAQEVAERVVRIAAALTANAVEHALPPVGLQVADDGRRWVVAVTDGAPHLAPVPRREFATAPGLQLVDELAEDHGAQYEHEHKVVWASVRRPA